MKIILPEHIGEITLGQYQEYAEYVMNQDKNFIMKGLRLISKAINPNLIYKEKKKIISIFCNVDIDLIDKFPITDIEDFYDQIMNALNETVEFQQKFKMNDIEFGFHPNLDQMTGAEWMDLSTYQSDISKYHRVMAVLFRPIIEADSFGNYELLEYNGTEKYAEMMKQMPLSIVNGALVFFLNLAKELENCILKYTATEQARERKLLTTLQGGVGMLR